MSGKLDPITIYKIGSPKEASKGLHNENSPEKKTDAPEIVETGGNLLRFILLIVIFGAFAIFGIWFMHLFS